MSSRAFVGADIFDGSELHAHKAVLVGDGRVSGICDADDIPAAFLPGFVDLQVSGGGGVMFNDETTVDGLAAIAQAHAKTGTRAILPTLITDTPERTRAAVDAAEQAISAGIPGIIGVHLEGPHLSIARKGAHDPSLIRKMEQEDEDFLVRAAKRLPNLMVTVAQRSAG